MDFDDTRLARILDLFAEDSWRNVYAGELEGAPTRCAHHWAGYGTSPAVGKRLAAVFRNPERTAPRWADSIGGNFELTQLQLTFYLATDRLHLERLWKINSNCSRALWTF
jgi:hypothetical protein